MFDAAVLSDADLVARATSLERRRTLLDAEEAVVLAELDAALIPVIVSSVSKRRGGWRARRVCPGRSRRLG